MITNINIPPSIIEMIELMLAPPAPKDGQDPIVVCIFPRSFNKNSIFNSTPYVASNVWTFTYLNNNVRILNESLLCRLIQRRL